MYVYNEDNDVYIYLDRSHLPGIVSHSDALPPTSW